MNANEELKLQNKINNIVQWEKEITQMDKQLESTKHIMDIFDGQVGLMRRNQEIMLDNFVIIKPTWKFETVPEYMENQKKLQMYAQETKEMEWKQVVDSRTSDYDRIKVQRIDLGNALDKLREEVKAMQGKGE